VDSGYTERALAFDCNGQTLIGVVAAPARPAERGVLIVVGGPQYRCGSHRQFVLLARHLASHGMASMRFDYTGMGDSTGALRNFEHIEHDIRAAIDQFLAAAPGLTKLYLWGLCDAATASIFYAPGDTRVTGMVLLNPWARTERGEAKAFLKHYYLRRMLDRSFWNKAVSRRLDVKASMAGLCNVFRQSREKGQSAAATQAALPQRMASALERFRGRILLVLSGNDLTAKEFLDATREEPRWRALGATLQIKRVDLAEANHTFSTRAWRDQVAELTSAWVSEA
jgi:uncharacterized protein